MKGNTMCLENEMIDMTEGQWSLWQMLIELCDTLEEHGIVDDDVRVVVNDLIENPERSVQLRMLALALLARED